MSVEGNNFRRIGRLLGVSYQSVVNWVNACREKIIFVYGQRFNVEKERLIRIFKRIISGLSYSLFNHKIDETAEVTIKCSLLLLMKFLTVTDG